MVSDLRLETKVPGSNPAANYVQMWTLCSNRPANNVKVSVKCPVLHECLSKKTLIGKKKKFSSWKVCSKFFL